MTQPSTGTVVAESRWSLAFIWLAFPALGAVAGWLLTVLAEWMTTLEWAPFQGPARLLDSAPEPAATIGAVAIGAIAGLVVAGMGAHEMLTVTVSDSAVAVRTRGATRTLERSDISAAFRDAKDLVFLGRGSEELAREKSDLGTAALEHAFRTQRWAEAMAMTQTSYEQSSPSSASSSGTGTTSTNTFGAAASSLVTDGTGGRRADQPRVLGQHAALVLGWRR